MIKIFMFFQEKYGKDLENFSQYQSFCNENDLKKNKFERGIK